MFRQRLAFFRSIDSAVFDVAVQQVKASGCWATAALKRPCRKVSEIEKMGEERTSFIQEVNHICVGT